MDCQKSGSWGLAFLQAQGVIRGRKNCKLLRLGFSSLMSMGALLFPGGNNGHFTIRAIGVLWNPDFIIRLKLLIGKIQAFPAVPKCHKNP
jgi:hypothetical protein